MINQQTFQGNWDEAKDKLRSRWSSLTDDDLFNGNVDQLVDAIQRRTGETRERIEQFFEQLSVDGAASFSGGGQTARAAAQPAADAALETSEPAANVAPMVQRSTQSLAVCFGAGVIAGIVVTLLWR